MSLRRIAAVMDKEFQDALRNRYVVMLMIILPIVFAAIPIVSLTTIRQLPPSQAPSGQLPPALARRLGHLPLQTQLEVFLAAQFMLLFWIAPLAIPMTIATYSVVGEKREKALEPLLATPVTTGELLAGKAVAAACPGIALSWGAYFLVVAAAHGIRLSPPALEVLWGPTAWLQIFLLAPLITLLATLTGLIVSSRVNDPRLAEQIGMVVILPLLGLIIGQSFGILWLSGTLLAWIAVFLVGADALLLALAVAIFERETILTRWR
ncbi:ABC transporter permease subunit [Thermoflexus sp.]|uniref:ABC transporter permease subunit n=1 Tax=Thermoflexus sp. TaxID=1969742 RepID=UPI0035E44774